MKKYFKVRIEATAAKNYFSRFQFVQSISKQVIECACVLSLWAIVPSYHNEGASSAAVGASVVKSSARLQDPGDLAYAVTQPRHAGKRNRHAAAGGWASGQSTSRRVTWGVPFIDQKPHKNLRLIDLSATLDLIQVIDMTQIRDDLTKVKEFGRNISKVAYSNKDIRETLVKDSYDAVVTEWFFSDSDAGYAAVQQVPWILLSGSIFHPHMEGLVDEVRSISTVPMVFHDFTAPMSFYERVVNTFTFIMMKIDAFLEESEIAARYETNFGPLAAARGVTLPPHKNALYNISVVLVNSHPSIAPALSLPPNVVDIGGYHIDKPQPLPQDVQKILDSSPQGVVYFSMGSVIKGHQLPLKLRKDLITIFGGLPYTVLWKFEEELQGLPKNVIVRKWWPQTGILAHSNVKLFITHGGLLSSIEAVQFGVPLLAIPVFGDQPSNAARAARAGYARYVPYGEDIGPVLKEELHEMLSNDSYYKQAKYLSSLFNNRPVSPRQLVTHYIELAIQSKGAYHLRSKTHLYVWYQRWFLDQLAVLLMLLSIPYLAVKRLCRQADKPAKKSKKN
ncbi:UDP-glucoronosyl and UDP-glucosyl transferase domain-containing protein [Phthorimaea operculella]|nr:UDP-glucoronosyl and UDP-glucosyl transferase domain-containing protein [Phthorimaea operculella]